MSQFTPRNPCNDRRCAYQPSISEPPVLRVRFMSPDGESHQASICTTWHSVSSTEAPEQRHRQVHPDQALPEAILQVCTKMGCKVLGIELVHRNTTDL